MLMEITIPRSFPEPVLHSPASIGSLAENPTPFSLLLRDYRIVLGWALALSCLPNLMEVYPENSSVLQSENVRRFLAAMDEMGIPRFELPDLEKGSMKTVVNCLLALKIHLISSESIDGVASSPGCRPQLFDEEMRKASPGSKFQCDMHRPVIPELPSTVLQNVGHKFHEAFQLKQVCYADLPVTKILEMMKSKNFENAPTQSLSNVVYGILDESVEAKNGEISNHVACLLIKVVQEIGRRLSTQADHLRTQNNIYRAHEEKHRPRIRELEALLSATCKETKQLTNRTHQIKSPRKKNTLKQELEISGMMQKFYSMEMEAEAKAAITVLHMRIKDLEYLLSDSNNKVKDLEASFESKRQRWNMKEKIYQSSIEFQFEAMQDLRSTFLAIKQEILETKKSYSYDFNHIGSKVKALTDAAGNYHEVLAENRKLFNELQNLKVFCRIRPFLPGQTGKLSVIESISENGQLVIANPSKPGKDGQRSYKFNEVFGPDVTQDVLDLMDIGFQNRAVGATALNARSSRSHSERVDRSEVTGDRLREAQHINKSLFSLGDVIFALAQKCPHVPYRNSKSLKYFKAHLAKTLMLVQLNPDASSYSETMSTLKFSEQVSGVELDCISQGNNTENCPKVGKAQDILRKQFRIMKTFHSDNNHRKTCNP
ncbi:TMV resistance protein N-like [Hibiscus syriacus]|uniref:TMV resistance protein N-like n=1 Tax=Hibiscus syriacus TaxID=106335 RepID=A0A6A2YK76_HIBSY|nr:TMV resistance protein N-like [Hibiscus syriacus]